jgi:hypothetical protein
VFGLYTILEEHNGSNIRAEDAAHSIHGTTTQQTSILTHIAVKTSNPTLLLSPVKVMLHILHRIIMNVEMQGA